MSKMAGTRSGERQDTHQSDKTQDGGKKKEERITDESRAVGAVSLEPEDGSRHWTKPHPAVASLSE